MKITFIDVDARSNWGGRIPPPIFLEKYFFMNYHLKLNFEGTLPHSKFLEDVNKNSKNYLNSHYIKEILGTNPHPFPPGYEFCQF